MKTKFTFFLLLASFITPPNLTAQVVELEWAKQVGGVSTDISYGIATDAVGNVYTTGRFEQIVDFDPGAGITNLSSNGFSDVFIQKLDPNGNLLWVKQMGGTQNDAAYGITTDADGNVYTSGFFFYTVDFDPGVGIMNLTSNGGWDNFIQKLDANGNLLWAKQTGGAVHDNCYSISTDVSGNVYTTGYFAQTVDFDPGAATTYFTSNGLTDIFIQKLDQNGDFLWAKQMGGVDDETGASVAIDVNGNVLTTGRFEQTVDFDPNAGTTNLISNGDSDAFVQKLDSNGNLLWVKQMGGTDLDLGYDITTDASGNVYTCGRFGQTVDFDPGAGTTNLTSNGGGDVFIQKLDANGNLLWVNQIGGTNTEFSSAIETDASGNVYITGAFQLTIDFDSGTGTTNLTSNGDYDVYILKLDTNGNLLWVKQMGGTSNDRSFSMTTDDGGNIYTTGYLSGTGDYDPGAGTTNLTSNGGTDIFIHKLNQCQTTYATDVQTACDTFTWMDGQTYTSSNNVATYLMTNAYGCDSIVTIDLTVNYSNSVIDVQTACDTYTWLDGNTYNASNNLATWTLTNALGCDSIVTLDLTVNYSNSESDVQTACDTYTWTDGNTYTASTNTPTWTLTNALGCDSVVTLDLTVNYSNSGTDVHTVCDSLQWIDGNTYTSSTNTPIWTLTNASGCDSVITLDLTVNYSNSGTDVQTVCESLTWIDGITYTSSTNTPTWTLTNASGCDSVITLDLTVNTINTLTTQLDDITIQANTSGVQYQWLNCDSNFVLINGETNQTFTATQNGSYAVRLIANGCADTSECVNITNVGIIENDFGDNLKIYPNPTDGNLIISLGTEHQFVEITIIDLNGKTVSNELFNESGILDVTIDGESGTYILKISSEGKNAQIKVVKK